MNKVQIIYKFIFRAMIFITIYMPFSSEIGKNTYIFLFEGLTFKFQRVGTRLVFESRIKHPDPMLLHKESSTRCLVFSHLSSFRVHIILVFFFFFSTYINLPYKNCAIFINNAFSDSPTRTSVILTF